MQLHEWVPVINAVLLSWILVLYVLDRRMQSDWQKEWRAKHKVYAERAEQLRKFLEKQGELK